APAWNVKTQGRPNVTRESGAPVTSSAYICTAAYVPRPDISGGAPELPHDAIKLSYVDGSGLGGLWLVGSKDHQGSAAYQGAIIPANTMNTQFVGTGFSSICITPFATSMFTSTGNPAQNPILHFDDFAAWPGKGSSPANVAPHQF